MNLSSLIPLNCASLLLTNELKASMPGRVAQSEPSLSLAWTYRLCGYGCIVCQCWASSRPAAFLRANIGSVPFPPAVPDRTPAE